MAGARRRDGATASARPWLGAYALAHVPRVPAPASASASSTSARRSPSSRRRRSGSALRGLAPRRAALGRLRGRARGALARAPLDLRRDGDLRPRAGRRSAWSRRSRSRPTSRSFGGVLGARERLARAGARGLAGALRARGALDRGRVSCARSRSPGFPWATLGYALHADAALRALAPLGGVYALSFAAVLGGAALAASRDARELRAAALAAPPPSPRCTAPGAAALARAAGDRRARSASPCSRATSTRA